MSFFKSLFKSTPPDPEPKQTASVKLEAKDGQAIPELYSGMKVEVLSPDNNLLFVGILKICGGVLEINSESGGALPIANYQQKVKLRGFQKNSQAFTLNGTVGQSSPSFWRLENLKFLQSKDSRAFFRQNAELKAEISPDIRGEERVPCKILDISAGGARILSALKLPYGSMFVLYVTLVPEEPPFSMVCQIRHIAPSGDNIEYGCQFVGLQEKERERLLQTIFTLQRKILQSRRD